MGISRYMAKKDDARIVAKTAYGDSKAFEVEVGMHQGSGLNLLLVTVMEAICREFWVSLPWKLLYMDDLVMIADCKKR